MDLSKRRRRQKQMNLNSNSSCIDSAIANAINLNENNKTNQKTSNSDFNKVLDKSIVDNEEENASIDNSDDNINQIAQILINSSPEEIQNNPKLDELLNKTFNIKDLDKFIQKLKTALDGLTTSDNTQSKSKEELIKQLLEKINTSDISKDTINVEYLKAGDSSLKEVKNESEEFKLLKEFSLKNQNSQKITEVEKSPLKDNVEKKNVEQNSAVVNDKSMLSDDNKNFKIDLNQTNISLEKLAVQNQSANAINTENSSKSKTKDSTKEELAKILASDEKSPQISGNEKSFEIDTNLQNPKKKDTQLNSNLSFLNLQTNAQKAETITNNSIVEIKSNKLEELAKLITDKIAEAKSGKTESAHVTVKLDTLGTVFVKIDLAENVANIKFESDSKDAINHIENNISALKDSFDKLGIKAENLNFEFRQDKPYSNENSQREGFNRNKNNENFFFKSDDKSVDLNESEQTNTIRRIKQGRLIETYV